MAESTNTAAATAQPKLSRKTLKKQGRDKRRTKLAAGGDVAKAYHEGKSKRSVEKKAAFRKKKKGKK